jgi:dethiobiotin synthetase
VLVVVLGTATDVGKTWVSAALLRELTQRGLQVAARKPAQSFDPDDPGPTDADVLAAATGERPYTVCARPFSYPVAYAPPMAAAHLGLAPPTRADLLCGIAAWPEGVDVGLVETAGGPRSPIATDADSVDLVAAMAADRIVLVADAGLGTINAVRLGLASLAPGTAAVVFLNRFDETDDLHRRNREWLECDGLTMVTTITDLADALTPAATSS